MILRPFLLDETACASYLFGCLTHRTLAVVDPHAELVDRYLEAAQTAGAPIVAVFETHVQADHVSGLPAIVDATGATAYLPAEAGVDFEHAALADGDRVELGNTIVTAFATPGDSLLVGDVGRPDLYAAGDPEPLARQLFVSVQRLLTLLDGVLVLPSHYAGSVCGRSLSGNPFSTIGFERLHNQALHADDFVERLVADVPPPPAHQAQIVAANRSGSLAAHA